MNLKQIAQKLWSKTQDDEGLIRRGQFRPFAPLDDKIKSSVSNIKTPTGTLGQNFNQVLSKGTQAFNPYQGMAENKNNNAFIRGGADIVNQGLKSFTNMSTLGLVQPKMGERQTKAGLIGSIGGGFAGFAFNPLRKVMGSTDTLVSKLAPKSVGLTSKVLKGLSSEALQTLGYSGASLLGSKLGLNQQTGQFTPKDLASNMVMGSILRGVGGATNLKNIKIKGMSPQVFTSDKTILNEAKQKLRVGIEIDQFSKLGKDLENMYKQYGLASFPDWNKLSIDKKVNILDDRLSEMARQWGDKVTMGIKDQSSPIKTGGDIPEVDKEIASIKSNLEKSRILRDKKINKLSAEINRLRENAKTGLTEDEYTVYKNTESELRHKISLANIKYNKESRLVEGLVSDLEKSKLSPIKTGEVDEIPKTIKTRRVSSISKTPYYEDTPIIRKEENITLYQGSKPGEQRQFWTPNKKYAEKFGDVKEKTGDFYLVDNGNMVTDVYIEVPKVSPLSPESVSKVENKLPPHLQKIVDKQNAIKPDFTIEEFTPKGFEQSNIETPPRLFEKLPNETGDMARARMVGYQIDNGKVKLTNTPSGWEARISDVGGENLVKSGYQNKQQLINDVYETLNPDIVYPKNLSPESKGIKITETPKIKLKTIPLEQPTGPELKQRGFSASVQEAPNVSKKVKTQVLGGYESKPNDVLMGEAKALLTEGGQIDFKNTKDIDKKVAATIQEALNQQKAGNHKAAADLFNNLSEQGTELGRGVQAFSLLKNMSPEAIALSAAGKIKKYNQTAKAKIPELTGEQVKAISDKVAEADLLKGEARNKALFEINKMINEYIPSSLSDKALTVWKAGLLTSLRTHIRNFVGNTIHGVSETAKDIPATIADIGLSAKTGKRTITPTIKGTSEAWSKDTVEQMRSILGSGYDPDKIIEKFDTKQITWGKNLVEKGLKAYTDTVFRLLGASDKPFYNAAMARSLYSQAGAEAINQGVRGNKAFIDNLVKNPTEDMLKIAISDANVATFKDRNKAVEIASALKRSMSTNKAGKVISEITMPFTGVPGSVLGQIISYSPAGLIKGSIDVGRVSLGNMPELQRQAAQEIGRGVIGTGIFGLGSYLMSKGLMTGQPKDQEEQRQWELENKPRNSIMIGGKWRSLNSIGPEAVVFLAGSKLNEELNSEEGNLGTYAVKLGKDYLDQSFVQGLQGPVNAITDPNRYAKSYIGNQLSSVVPNIVKDISKATDPYQREANTVMDYAKQGIPGARQTLTERRDVLGNIIPQEPTGGAAFVDLFNSKTPIKNDVVDELSRLNEAGYNATPSKLQVTQTIKGVKGKLTQQQLDVLETKSGLATSTAIDKLIKTSGYQKLNDEDKQKAIDNLVTKTRKQVRSTIDLSVMPDMGYTTSEDSPKGLGRVGLYGKSLVTDPGQTLKAVIAGNPIRKVEGGAVILERKNALGTLDAGDKTTEVDHIIALTLGGTNDKSNLQILTKEENRIKGQIETYLYNEMKAGRITKKEAQERDKNWKDEIDNLPQATKEKLVTELSTDTSDTGTTGDTYQIINEDTGNITTIDLSKPIEEPEYTGFDELDKKLKSSYKSAITTRISNITKLYKDGQITAEKANKLISELKTKSGTGTKKKSKKKITFKVTSPKALPKITLKISSPVSRVKLKSAPKIKLSKTDNRKYTIKA